MFSSIFFNWQGALWNPYGQISTVCHLLKMYIKRCWLMSQSQHWIGFWWHALIYFSFTRALNEDIAGKLLQSSDDKDLIFRWQRSRCNEKCSGWQNQDTKWFGLHLIGLNVITTKTIFCIRASFLIRWIWKGNLGCNNNSDIGEANVENLLMRLPKGFIECVG